jgi:hypothetical protein
MMNTSPTKTAKSPKPTQDTDLAKERIKNELLKRRLLIEKYKRNSRLAATLLIVVGLVVVGYIFFVARQPSTVPKSITSSVQFPIFYPKPGKQITIKQTSFKYDKSLGQVSFIVNYAGSAITFAEQSSPDSFSADPTFYPAFIQKLNGYDTFSGVDGRVDLTLPSETHEQTAIMNAKGTLVFASTSGKISESSWKLLFYSLSNTQP